MSDKNPKLSRADRPDDFDFNKQPQPAHVNAARSVKSEQLERLFEQLDRADELFDNDARKGTLAAARAVAEFLRSTQYGATGRFSRPIELFIAELVNRPASDTSRILPADGSGSGGISARRSEHYVKAAAAYTVEFLYSHCGIEVGAAARWVADELSGRGVPFATRRASKESAVKAWRRDYRRKNQESVPALAFRAYRDAPPVQATGNAEVDASVILGWFRSTLAQAGYGPTA